MAGQGSDSNDQDLLGVDEDEILAEYRLLSWTRLMRIEDFEEGQERKIPLGPDVVEECQAVADLEEVDPVQRAPVFDPAAFNEAHQPLAIEDYRLQEEDLRAWAERCVTLRAAFNERAR